MLRYIVKYRKEVITKNLKNSFPDLSESKINEYRKGYYHHLCDLIFESVKNVSITEKDLRGSFTFENLEVLEDLYKKGKSVVVMGGHFGNWERYAMVIGGIGKHQQLAIYKPIKDKFLNTKMKEVRGKFGQNMISMLMTKKYFIKEPERLKCITFALDQWTSNPKAAHWGKFLNQDTPFFSSAEMLAKQFDWAAVYCGLDKHKRGHYHGTFEVITYDAKSMGEGEITDSFIAKLEANILTNPPHWLWSHRRWKKTKEEVFS